MERQRIGDFRIVRTLGRGGMGAVYEGVPITAAEIDIPERVAIKMLLSHHDSESDDELRQRFVSEINTLKHLRHPNIVRLYGFGADDGHPYYVMELVDGLSLSAELKWQRRFEWIEAAKIGLDLCSALKYAGDRGIIHRDIKPANIMLDSQTGVIKLSDFGIAHFFGADQTSDLYSIIGTLEYMAPEQALGRPVGPKADLYAVGAVVYTLLARRPPHTGKSLNEIREKHQNETIVPISSLRRDVPPDITFLIDELLNVDPQKRPIGAQMVVRRFQATLRALVGDPDKILLTPTDTSRGQPPADNLTSGSSPNQVTLALQPHAQSDQPTPISVPVGETCSPADPRAATRTSGEDANSADSLDTYQVAEPVARNDNSLRVQSVTSSVTPSHFVVVREEELGQYETPPARVVRPMFVLKTVSIVVCLAAIAAAMFYLLQPLPADDLLRRINATITDAAGDDDSDRIAALSMAEHDINAFLRRFPDHASSATLQGYLDELKVAERQKHLETRLLRLDPRQLLPIERVYLETWSIRQSDPELAAERMRAILLLYRSDSASTAQEQGRPKAITSRHDQVIDRVTAQLQTWDVSQKAIQEATLTFLRQRLDEAKAREASDPEGARAIRLAIVELYGQKPWAAEIVKTADESIGARSVSE
ncbi:MAG: serine/threonine protein kinase [Thermoguttaceae bacterium]